VIEGSADRELGRCVALALWFEERASSSGKSEIATEMRSLSVAMRYGWVALGKELLRPEEAAEKIRKMAESNG